MPLAQIRSQFGDMVTDLVDAVTELGPTRQARNARVYAGLRACPAAAADRIANVEAAPPGSDHMARRRCGCGWTAR